MRLFWISVRFFYFSTKFVSKKHEHESGLTLFDNMIERLVTEQEQNPRKVDMLFLCVARALDSDELIGVAVVVKC
jgi:hypothetical protein